MLTAAQLSTLKAAINADANLAALRGLGDAFQIAAYYNQLSNPAVSIWRPGIAVSELNTAIVWSAFATLTVAQQNTYLSMTQGGVVDATSANIQGGFLAVFGSASASLTALTTLAKRTATKFEALFTTASVCAVFGQQAAASDISAALISP